MMSTLYFKTIDEKVMQRASNALHDGTEFRAAATPHGLVAGRVVKIEPMPARPDGKHEWEIDLRDVRKVELD